MNILGKTDSQASSQWLMAVDITVLPTADQEAFDAWYDEVHLPEIASCPGFISGVRFTHGTGPTGDERRDLTLYELEGPWAIETPEFAERRGFRQFSTDVQGTVRVYRRHGGRVATGTPRP